MEPRARETPRGGAEPRRPHRHDPRGPQRRLALCLLKQEAASKRSIKGQRLKASGTGITSCESCGGAEFSIRLPRYKGYLVPPASPGSDTAKEQELLAGEVQNRLNETSPRVVQLT
jgi:hypothetical protein